MKNPIRSLLWVPAIVCMAVTCKKQNSGTQVVTPTDTSLVNTAHLDYLYTPVNFPDGTNAAGVYIYADAPNYVLTPATGEGYVCVDDASRAALVYLRQSIFSTDTAIQSKVFKLINFLLEMQSANGYFYNFLLTGNQINTIGPTSINNPEWWSWRALQALTEGSPLIKPINAALAAKMDNAVIKLVAAIKIDLVNLPKTTSVVGGITVPEWLPAGSGTDQSSTLILGLIPYCTTTGDATITTYLKKLADGIVLMQQGDSASIPFGAFLSWENTWHSYGNEQAFALLKAGVFLNNPLYTASALTEIGNFYPWLLQNGLKASFVASNSGSGIQLSSEQSYSQIAYGIRPMVFAAIEAYRLTGQDKYADLAGHLAAWFLGANDAKQDMYSVTTGLGYDGISSPTSVNVNSGAESTIEALFTMQQVEHYPAVKAALNKYKK
jgi:hypothetical protein